MSESAINISDAAIRSGLPAKTIRYYEDIDLIVPERAANGYRTYSETEIHKLAFVRRLRTLGFSIKVCRLLLSLYENKDRSSADVKRLAEKHLIEIEQKLKEISEARYYLKRLIDYWQRNDRTECPSFNSFEESKVNLNK